MHLIGFAVVRNESDIIESFVRFNLAVLDELWIVDNGSADSTAEILRRLAEEYPSLTVRSDSHLDHRQEITVTELVREANEIGDLDFAVLLDADEFIVCDGRRSLEAALEALPPLVCGAVPWVTYVPKPQDDWSEPDVLRRVRHRRVSEPKTFTKVIVPAAAASFPDFGIAAGSHRAFGQRGEPMPMHQLEGIALAHFPVRSSEQLTAKVLLGEWSLSVKTWRGAGEGFHWRALAQKTMTAGVLSRDELEEVAAGYPSGTSAPQIEAPMALPEGYKLRYPDFIDVDVVKRLAAFGNRYFGELSHRAFANEYVAVGRTRFGPLAYLRSDTVIGRSIELYGEWAAHELSLLLPLLRPGDVALDIGANIGSHTVPFAKAVGPGGRVYAFEPQRPVYQVLCANAVLNGLANIHAVHAGVAEQAGTIHVESTALTTRGNVGNYRLQDAEGGESVPLVRIDDLTLPQVRLIKVDVEGMEREVLAGARGLIARDRPILFVENNLPELSEKLLREVASLRYRAYWHFADYYNPFNFFGNGFNFFSSVPRPEINLVCVPAESGLVPQGLTPVSGPDENWRDAFTRSQTRTQQ